MTGALFLVCLSCFLPLAFFVFVYDPRRYYIYSFAFPLAWASSWAALKGRGGSVRRLQQQLLLQFTLQLLQQQLQQLLLRKAARMQGKPVAERQQQQRQGPIYFKGASPRQNGFP